MEEQQRKTLERHFTQAEQVVAQGIEHIGMQKKLITELIRDGHDAAAATDLLNTLQQSQKLHVEYLDRLRLELGLS